MGFDLIFCEKSVVKFMQGQIEVQVALQNYLSGNVSRNWLVVNFCHLFIYQINRKENSHPTNH